MLGAVFFTMNRFMVLTFYFFALSIETLSSARLPAKFRSQAIMIEFWRNQHPKSTTLNEYFMILQLSTKILSLVLIHWSESLALSLFKREQHDMSIASPISMLLHYLSSMLILKFGCQVATDCLEWHRKESDIQTVLS